MIGAMTEAIAVRAPAEQTGRLVPLSYLAFPAVSLTLLFVGIVSNSAWLLNGLHVFFGALWTGVDLFAGFVVGPVMRKLAPPVRKAFMERYMPRMLVIMPTLATLTLTAAWQVARKTDFLTVPYPRHWWLVASFVIVGVMATVAFAVMLPSNLQVLFELRKAHPNVALIGKLTGRYATFAAVLGVMQIGTIVIMSRLATF
jgi:hypothetical protein